MLDGLIYGANGIYFYFAGLVVALFLVWIKGAFKTVFAIIEICAGFLLLCSARQQAVGAFSSGFSDAFQRVHTSIALLSAIGAVFLFARGLEDLLKSRNVIAS